MQDGEAPVLIATGKGEKEILKALLEKEADPNLVRNCELRLSSCVV